MEFKGLKRQTSQASMNPYGEGLGTSEIYDRQSSAARRLQRQESVPANKLVRIRLCTFLYNIICMDYCALSLSVKKKKMISTKNFNTTLHSPIVLYYNIFFGSLGLKSKSSCNCKHV